jgi:hypothetical protein
MSLPGEGIEPSVPADRDVADEVLEYLHRHPAAIDTLDGIVNWWLPRQRYETARARIQQALDRLVAQGLVESKMLADGTTVYCRRGADTQLRH